MQEKNVSRRWAICLIIRYPYRHVLARAYTQCLYDRRAIPHERANHPYLITNVVICSKYTLSQHAFEEPISELQIGTSLMCKVREKYEGIVSGLQDADILILWRSRRKWQQAGKYSIFQQSNQASTTQQLRATLQHKCTWQCKRLRPYTGLKIFQKAEQGRCK